MSLSGQTSPDSLQQVTDPTKVVSVKPQGLPVTADSSVYIYLGIGPYSLEKRAERISKKLQELKEGTYNTANLEISEGNVTTDLICDGVLIMSINDADATAIGLSRKGATDFYLEQIIDFTESIEEERMSVKSLLVNAGIALVIVIVFAIGLKYFNRLFRLVYIKIQGQKGRLFKGFSVKNYELLT